MDASYNASSVPNTDLSGEMIMNINLRKIIGKYGMLKIFILSDLELQKVRTVLKSLLSDLLDKYSTKPIILDTDWSKSATGFRDDFVEATLVQILHTHLMYGIDESL